MMRNFISTLALLVGAFSVINAVAHELQENKVNLTLRAQGHVDAVFYMNLIDALQKPTTKPASKFVLLASLASQNDEEFTKTWKSTTASLQSEIQFRSASGKALSTSPWTWTDARQVHKYLREVTMSAIATPDQHVHDMTIEARVQIKTQETTLNVVLPEHLKPMTLVATQPKQYRIERGSPQISLGF